MAQNSELFICGLIFVEWRPQYHSPQTIVSFHFPIQLHYAVIDGTRWKTIKYKNSGRQD